MINVTVARYALGALALLLLAGSLGAAAVALRRRYLPEFAGAPARLAEVLLGLMVLTGMLELLGAIGAFALGPIAAVSAVIGIFAARRLRDARRQPRAPAPGAWRSAGHPGRLVTRGVLLAGLAAAAVLVEWVVPAVQSYDVGIRSFDSLWYHLPWAASFAQTGHIAPLRFTDVEYLTAFYPATAELFHGLGIVLWARDTLSPALNIGWLGLVLLAAYCVGRPRGLGWLTTAGAALAMATPMMRFSQPGSAANDVVGIFFLLAAAALILSAEERRFALGLAGASAGLAIAVKLSMVVPALALALGSLATSPVGRRRSRAAVITLPLLLASSFWYARNLILVGNPLPWTGALGLPTPAPPGQSHTAFTVAHYLGNAHVLRHVFVPGLAAGLGPWWPAVVAVALAGPLLCLLAGASTTTRMLGAVALLSLGAYLITPESAAGPAGRPVGFAFNLRYAAPALTLCLTVLPLAAPIANPRRQLVVFAVLALLLASVLGEARLWPSSHVPVAVLIGAGALVVIYTALRAPRSVRLALLASCGALGVVGGYYLQRHYLRGRYVYHPGVSSLARVWALFRHVHGQRVGVVGTFGGFFSYPLFGAEDSNRVSYVAQRGAHGSFQPIGSCRRWRQAVSAGRYSYVVTTPARDPWHPTVLSSSPESGWTALGRGARVVYSQRAAGQVIRVYELGGRLDPADCPSS